MKYVHNDALSHERYYVYCIDHRIYLFNYNNCKMFRTIHILSYVLRYILRVFIQFCLLCFYNNPSECHVNTTIILALV